MLWHLHALRVLLCNRTTPHPLFLHLRYIFQNTPHPALGSSGVYRAEIQGRSTLPIHPATRLEPHAEPGISTHDIANSGDGATSMRRFARTHRIHHCARGREPWVNQSSGV